MKLNRHLTGLIAAVASCAAVASPLLTEGFDNISTLAGAGWVTTNNSSPVGSTGWFQGNSGVFTAASGAADSYIAANFNNALPGGAISNWLITPEVGLTNGETLNFALRLLGEGLLDKVEVYMSTNGISSNVGDFSMLISYSSDIDTEWMTKSIFVSGLSGPASGRFAFRYVVNNTNEAGDYIGIDSVSVNAAEVPEPTSLALAALALGGLGLIRRKQRRGLDNDA